IAEVLHPATAYLVTNFLEGVLVRGTARSARTAGFYWRAAGKTGPTEDSRDAWFVGDTPHLLVVLWVRSDANYPLGFTGAQLALPLWFDFMKARLVGRPSQAFLPPPGIVQVTVDPTSGGIATAECPTRVTELFIEGTEPTGLCPLHGMGK